MSNGTKAKYLTLFIIFNFVTYFGIQLLFTVSEYNFLITLDHSIPFIPEFVWIYHTLIPVILITMFSFVSRKEVFLSAFTATFYYTHTLTLLTIILFNVFIYFRLYYYLYRVLDLKKKNLRL